MTARRTQSSRRADQLSRTERFRFRRTDSIGAAAAEDDGEVLKHCYVDTGDLQLLQDIGDRRRIILGRTGAGKSALLAILEQSRPGRAIKLSTEHLALPYVANSTILNFFGSIGVNLDPFFKLLWRHVLTVEILTHHFEHRSEPSKSLFERLRALFVGPSKHDKDMRQAIQYLADWGETFWAGYGVSRQGDHKPCGNRAKCGAKGHSRVEGSSRQRVPCKARTDALRRRNLNWCLAVSTSLARYRPKTCRRFFVYWIRF